MAVAASSEGRDAELRGQDNDFLPLQGKNWTERLSPVPDASGYMELCRIADIFAANSMREIATVCTMLVNSARRLVQSARQARAIRLEELKYAREIIESAQLLYPEISGEAVNIYTDGARAKIHASTAESGA